MSGITLANRIELWPLERLRPYAKNARTHSEAQVDKICASIMAYGFNNPILVDEDDGIVAGHGRYAAATKLDMAQVPVISLSHLTPAQRRAYVLADNRTFEDGGWDTAILAEELAALAADDEIDMDSLGFSDHELAAFLGDDLLPEGHGLPPDAGADGVVDGGATAPDGDAGAGAAPAPAPVQEKQAGALAARFGVPPFSVLDARNGWWQDRKRAWIAMGIRSELGRDGLGVTVNASEGVQDYMSGRGGADGGSVFDPVLCELAYRWFCPQGGTVLDPFAGGSVRGIVAAKLGLQYVGGELRAEQVEANRTQWAGLANQAPLTLPLPSFDDDNLPELTPVEQRGPHWVKRDDAFVIGGGRGGKVRTCWALAQGATGLVTAGSRSSPQVNIVAQIARKLGIPCRVHTPEGELSPEVRMAQAAGAEVVQHRAGYNSVIIARARADAQATGWREIPFGMECAEAVEATAGQVTNIPEGVRRIVMPVGSGMSLAGVLHGLARRGLRIPVVGVRVGADPTERLDMYAPAGWRDMVQLVDSGTDYHAPAREQVLHGLRLDPIYEAKCLPHLQDGDLLWVVGIRASEAVQCQPVPPVWHCADSRYIDQTAAGVQADMLMSCPPYADLEVYSDDPADISGLGYPEFRDAYFEIIAKACSLLREDRFAVWVVGEVRDKRGNYYNFVGDTIEAFRRAGLHYYNEGILLTPAGTLPIRAGRQFAAGRKLGKTHQNVLVFVKGDWKRAAEACGVVEFGDADLGPANDNLPAADQSASA